MRDPTIHFDPETKVTEAATEDTRRLLEPIVRTKIWEADFDHQAKEIFQALFWLEEHAPDWVKAAVREPLLKAARKRSKKPTRHSRDIAIACAARRLRPRYLPSRNDETKHIEAASSIIYEALRRLGVEMEEKTIKGIVLKYPLDDLC
jgi:hypothetical protein